MEIVVRACMKQCLGSLICKNAVEEWTGQLLSVELLRSRTWTAGLLMFLTVCFNSMFHDQAQYGKNVRSKIKIVGITSTSGRVNSGKWWSKFLTR